jgi:hypothetical protein
MTAPASLVTLGGETVLGTGLAAQAGAGAISGTVGGITTRAITSGGDSNKAFGTLGQIGTDAALGAATPIINAKVINPLVKESTGVGRAVSVGEQKLAQGYRASPSLPIRQLQLKNKQKIAGTATSTAIKTVVKKRREDEQSN